MVSVDNLLPSGVHLLLMDVKLGHGGWVRYAEPDQPLTYIRFARSEAGRWVVTELYMATDETAPIRPDSLKIRLAALETFANRPDVRAAMERDRSPGPDLRRLASHFSATFSRRATHWVAQSYWANFPKSGVKQAPMGKEPAPDDWQEQAGPRLETPPEGLTDDFLRQVAEAYASAVKRGKHPAPAIANASGVSVSAVRKWVYTARKRKIMAAGQQGKVG